MTASTPVRSDVPVDHVIFYTGDGLDDLAVFFQAAGFNLTPLGRHDSGSVNRLAILDGQYIELMGFEPGTPITVRPELRTLAPGLNGIVAADRPGLRRNFDADRFKDPVSLTRPVTIAGAGGVARFSITALRDPVPDVRVFLCRHHTPGLVWQDHWKRHANGALDLKQISMATRHPLLLRKALQAAFNLKGDDEAGFFSCEAARTRIEVLSSNTRSALAVRTADLESVIERVRRHNLHHVLLKKTELAIPLPAPYEADLIFTTSK